MLLCKFKKKATTALEDLEDRRSNSVFEKASEKMDEASEFIEKVQPVSKIILSYFQVATGLAFVFDLRFPPIFSKSMEFVSGIVNLNFISLMPLGCIFPSNYHSMLLGYTLLPIFAASIMMVHYKVLGRRNDASTVELRNTIFSSFLFGTFVVLPTMSVKIFSTFACKEFDQGYGTFLKVDYSIDCESDEHALYTKYAFLMIAIYPGGIPTLYHFLLHGARKKLDPRQRELSFELNSETAGQEKALEERKKHEESDPNIKALFFLYGAYEPQCYWFEVFETLRKLALTGGLVFLKPGTASQIMMSMILCLGSMRIYAGYKPFIEDKVDTFAEVAQWQLFFTMFAALAIRVNVDGESLQDRNAFDVMLVILQFIAPFSVVVHYFVFEARDDARSMHQTKSDVHEEWGLASSGVRDVFSGFKTSVGGDKDKQLAIENDEDGLELGNIGKDSKKASAVHAVVGI